MPEPMFPSTGHPASSRGRVVRSWSTRSSRADDGGFGGLKIRMGPRASPTISLRSAPARGEDMELMVDFNPGSRSLRRCSAATGSTIAASPESSTLRQSGRPRAARGQTQDTYPDRSHFMRIGGVPRWRRAPAWRGPMPTPTHL